MTPLVAVGKILLSAAAEVLVDLTKRATSAAKDRLRRTPVDAPPPISADKHLDGMLDGIDRERSRALSDEMTERARKQLDNGSDEP